MRILIEICLTICEWIQERNIRRAARKAARECEKKSILTYLSQGAVGGIVGYFLLVAASIVLQPRGYSFIFFFVLPIFLAFGAVFGFISPRFFLFAGKLFKRKHGFLARFRIVLTITHFLSISP